MFRAIKRVFIWLGLMAEQVTETDARKSRRSLRMTGVYPALPTERQAASTRMAQRLNRAGNPEALRSPRCIAVAQPPGRKIRYRCSP